MTDLLITLGFAALGAGTAIVISRINERLDKLEKEKHDSTEENVQNQED